MFNKVIRMLKDLYKSPLFISVVIAVITLAIFWRVLSADFVMWDDDRMVYLNPDLTSLSFEHLSWIFTHTDVTRRYTPLAALNYSITYQLCRLNPFGYHLSPWLFHGLNAALVFLVLRILLIKGLLRQGKTNIDPWWITFCAAVGALVWSLHPLRTETVAWVGANFYAQAMFFLLLSLLCYLWADKADISSRSHLRRILASAGLFAAALLSHPIVIGFFVVLIALDVYPLGKMRGKWWMSAQGRRALLEKVPFVVVGLIITAVTVIIRLKDVESAHVSLSQFGLFDRMMQAMYICAYYIWRPWYPVNLAPVYTTLVSFNPLSLPFVASAMMVTGMIILLILLRRRWPLGMTLAVCYLALLVPVLGVLEHPHYPCDRYSLIVSICFSVLLAVFLANVKTKGLVSYIAIFLSIAIIVTLGTLSFRQTRVWNNTASLFEHIIRIFDDDPYSYEIHRRLGVFYFKQGRYTEAMELFKKTIEINPVQINPGLAPEQQGKYAAIAHFTQAVRLMPDLDKARNNTAKALVVESQIDEALAQFRAAIRLRPDWPALMNDFALLMVTHPELKSRDVNEAIRLASRACELTNYKNTAFLSTLAVAYSSANRFSEAAQTLETALNLDPNSAALHNGLGNVLLSQGKFKEAIGQMQRSLEIEPNNPNAKSDMAWILATCPDSNMRNPSEAIRLAQESCIATNYRKAGKLDTLGAAYACAGRFAEAIEMAEKALSLVNQSQTDQRKTIQSHLDLYKASRPYIETRQKDQNVK